MDEAEPPGVQRLAGQEHQPSAGVAADLAAGDLRAAAILAVAQHRAADVAQVHADLVRPAGLGQHQTAAKPSNRSWTW